MTDAALIFEWTSPHEYLASLEDRVRFLRRPIARAVEQGRAGDASAENGARAFLSHLQVARRLEHGDASLVSLDTLELYIRSHSESCVGVFPPPLGRAMEKVLLDASFGDDQEYDATGMLLPPADIPPALIFGTKESAIRLGAITCVLFEQGRLGAAAAFGDACMHVHSSLINSWPLVRVITRLALAASMRGGFEISVPIDIHSDSYLQVLSGEPPRYSRADSKSYILLSYLYSLSAARAAEIVMRSDTDSETDYGEVRIKQSAALSTLSEVRPALMMWLPPMIRRYTLWKLDVTMLDEDVATLAATRNACAGCGTEQLYLSKCGGCMAAWFCSTACHKAAWPRHKAACRSCSCQAGF